jgi:hypothetical protein
MPNAPTITSANTVFMISVAGLFTAPQQLQDYSADDIFDFDTVQMGESMVGADGIGVAGFTPWDARQMIRFMQSSVSIAVFELWIAAEAAVFDKFYATGIVMFPSLGKKYTLWKGSLSRGQPAPTARRVLAPREFEITWLPRGIGYPAISLAPF